MRQIVILTSDPEMVLAMKQLLVPDPIAAFGYYGRMCAAKTLVRDRRELQLLPVTYARFQLAVGAGPAPLEHDDQWLYENFTAAWAAFERWNGTTDEPSGWYHHPATGRRRPGGDASKEYVR